MTSGIPIQKPRLRGNSGFTMIEVLVAFVVLATLTLAVQRGLAASLSSMTRSEARLGAELVARTLISAPLGAGPSALRSQTGSMNGYDWRIRFEAVELPIAARNVNDGKPPQWRPVRMVITVSAPSGSVLKIETIRLVGG
jgi:prepilin-type N-terminal cleavage/methylation domain-containing protein